MARTIRNVALVSLLSLLVAGCSSGGYSLREADGSYAYLKTPKLVPLTVPKGMTLPQTGSTYVINTQTNLPGELGKKVDIRPPLEPLALLNHSVATYSDGVASVTFSTKDPVAQMWSELLNLLRQLGIKSQSGTADKTLDTLPYTWNHHRKAKGYTASYQIELKQTSQGMNLTVKLMSLTLGKQKIQSPIEIQRYTVLLLNKLQETALQSQQPNAVKTPLPSGLPLQADQISASVDHNGLSQVMLNQSYQTVWQQLPAILTKMGFTIDEIQKSQGMLQLKFSGLNKQQLQQLGLNSLTQLTKGKYQLQLGDLTKGTSLQLSDSDGNPVSKAVNTDFINLLKAALTSSSVTQKR